MIVFRKKGLLTTVQDLGRVGYQRYGMPVCGTMDPLALALANILVGNPRDEAALEATILGPTIEFEEAEVFAITGGDFAPTLNGAPIETNKAYLAQGGDVLALPMARRGARAYIALAGGLAVDEVMGSRSTCLKAGIGGLEGRAIRAGDRLGLRAPRISLPQGAAIPPALLPRCGDPVALRFTYGPQDDLFTAAGKRAFIGGTYALSDRSDRMGYRLEGPTVALIPGCDGNIVSDGVCFGAIEITGGQPIVMMADRQTTGGYPKIGCVIGADLPRLAQCKAGDRVRFRPVSVAAAQEAYRRQRQALDSFENGFGKEADHD